MIVDEREKYFILYFQYKNKHKFNFVKTSWKYNQMKDKMLELAYKYKKHSNN
ncbi:hypothetical protein O185_15560 [Photorhabdus temperata J3]|uniref:Uncharacterized protein n=1 Tax=Photorhabdus temperata J3 TaxID=1389415 RepID=U7QYQ0_PHOTE|nr:hypothetical protein O185_15560 [Photorhabdus temperata J3]